MDMAMRTADSGRTDPVALVLHDDDRMLGLLHGLLADAGFDVVTADSPYRAVGPGTPMGERRASLVLLGLSALDDRDLELVSILRDRWPHATLLLLFPGTLRERAARALALGADGYLPEPFYPGELASLALRAYQVETNGTGSYDQLTPQPESEATTQVPPAPDLPAPDLPAPDLPAPDLPAPAAAGDPTPVEELAAGVAHSIRNPLQILELMIGSAETADDLDVDSMRQQIQRIADVVQGLTRFGTRGREVEPASVDLNELVRQVFPSRRRRTGPRFALDLSDRGAQVLGEHEALTTALEILRNRAVRLTPSSSVVAVRTHIDGDHVELTVTDGGPAPSDEHARLFFRPTPDNDAVQEGTWLELAAFAGIVRNHGGSTAVGPSPENGTAIVVRLPARREV